MALLYRMGTGNGSGGDLKPYTVNFECASGYIGQTLTMTYQGTPHAGEVVDNVSGTVGSDGTLTLYPMHSGIWECSCYSSVIGKTMTKTIDLSYWGIQPTVVFEDTPNGATATPTDDIQTWLKCAGLNKSYTTISQVLADTNTLSALISDNNASDYLARSTTWVSDVCNNESAMIYIGLDDYCANKLLDNSTWLNAIGNSAYFEKVLNKCVPPLTSNTGSDGGEASGDFDNPAYYTFADASDKLQGTSNISIPKYVAYDFKKPVIVRLIKIKSWGGERTSFKPWNMTLIGDNGAEEEICKLVGNNNVSEQKFNITNNSSYNKYKLVVENAYNDASTTEQSTTFCNLDYVNFYGREGV